MSELLEQSDRRKNLLKHMIRQLHEGVAPEAVRTQRTRLLGQVPCHEVVEVEQQLIQEGLPVEEVLRRTVAKIATLRQMAKVGGLEVGTLRAAAGISPCDTGALDGGWESSGPPS